MPGELESAANDFVAAIDSLDLERIMQAVAQDVQSVDEVSRRWLRGNDEVRGYLALWLGCGCERRPHGASRGAGARLGRHGPSDMLDRAELHDGR